MGIGYSSARLAVTEAATGDAVLLQVKQSDEKALRHPWSRLFGVKWRETVASVRGRGFAGQGLIDAAPDRVQRGFAGLADGGFAEYNYPQVWVERRQIPRALHNRVPARSARVLDLGCGPGTSTEVLCWFASPDWRITGFDLTEAFIGDARGRAAAGGFKNARGERIAPGFECQSVAEPLLADGEPVPDRSVDFAISGGVVGLYLKPDAGRSLLAELRRVIRPGGHAAIDSGPSIPPRMLRRLGLEAGFEVVGLAKSFVIEPRPKVIFRAPVRPKAMGGPASTPGAVPGATGGAPDASQQHHEPAPR